MHETNIRIHNDLKAELELLPEPAGMATLMTLVVNLCHAMRDGLIISPDNIELPAPFIKKDWGWAFTPEEAFVLRGVDDQIVLMTRCGLMVPVYPTMVDEQQVTPVYIGMAGLGRGNPDSKAIQIMIPATRSSVDRLTGDPQ